MRRLLLLCLFSLPAFAADPASPASRSAAAPAGATVTADLHDAYVQGEPLLVNVTVRNSGTTPITVPDLSARPWHVHFRFTLPDGHSQDRFNTPPKVEPAGTWTIAPRSERRVLLEVPSGDAMKAGFACS